VSKVLKNEAFFFGEYEHALDSQNRIAIPSEWRTGEPLRLILLPGRDKDLLLFPFETFREFLLRARRLSLANREAQLALAKIGARARDCRCDKQGRIKLDRAMLDSIGVKTQLKLIGALTHIKLCAPEVWAAGVPLGDEDCLNEFDKINRTLPDLASVLAETLEDRKNDRR